MKKKIATYLSLLHGFCSRGWVITALAVYWFNRVSLKSVELQSILIGPKKEFFYLGLICAVVFVLAGSGSIFTHPDIIVARTLENIEVQKRRRRNLAIQYLILSFILGPRTYWWYRVSGWFRFDESGKEFFYFVLTCVIVLLLAEVGKNSLYTHLKKFYGKDAEKFRQKWSVMWILLHALFLLPLLGAGIYWQYLMIFR